MDACYIDSRTIFFLLMPPTNQLRRKTAVSMEKKNACSHIAFSKSKPIAHQIFFITCSFYVLYEGVPPLQCEANMWY